MSSMVSRGFVESGAFQLGRRLLSVAALVALAGCRLIPEGHPPAAYPPPPSQSYSAPTPPANALSLGVVAGPDLAIMGLTPANSAPALVSFRESCPRLAIRHDISGLTNPNDWQGPCAAAATWPSDDAANFFLTWFDSVVVGTGAAYVTGYYEPEIAGVRTRQPGYAVPVYGVPSDLVRARPGDAVPKPSGDMPFGRYDDTGHFAPYFDRARSRLAGRRIRWSSSSYRFREAEGCARPMAA